MQNVERNLDLFLSLKTLFLNPYRVDTNREKRHAVFSRRVRFSAAGQTRGLIRHRYFCSGEHSVGRVANDARYRTRCVLGYDSGRRGEEK